MKEDNKKSIWTFNWDCGRHGEVEGVFSATKKDIEKAIGCGIYFGEILGKHSEVFGFLDWKDLTEIICDEEFINKCEELKIIPTGYNPLCYID